MSLCACGFCSLVALLPYPKRTSSVRVEVWNNYLARVEDAYVRVIEG